MKNEKTVCIWEFIFTTPPKTQAKLKTKKQQKNFLINYCKTYDPGNKFLCRSLVSVDWSKVLSFLTSRQSCRSKHLYMKLHKYYSNYCVLKWAATRKKDCIFGNNSIHYTKEPHNSKEITDPDVPTLNSLACSSRLPSSIDHQPSNLLPGWTKTMKNQCRSCNLCRLKKITKVTQTAKSPQNKLFTLNRDARSPKNLELLMLRRSILQNRLHRIFQNHDYILE